MTSKRVKERRGGFLSIKGLLISALVIFILSILDYLLIRFLSISFIQGLMPISYIFIVGIVTGVYSSHASGKENILTAFIFSVMTFIIVTFSSFIVYLVTSATDGYDIRGIKFFDYFLTFEFSQFWVLGKPITGPPLGYILNFAVIVLMTLLYLSRFKRFKDDVYRERQVMSVQDDFIARNIDADMTNPFVQARMWTERGLISKGVIQSKDASAEFQGVLEKLNQEKTVMGEAAAGVKVGLVAPSAGFTPPPTTLDEAIPQEAQKPATAPEESTKQELVDTLSEVQKSQEEKNSDDEKDLEAGKELSATEKVKEMWAQTATIKKDVIQDTVFLNRDQSFESDLNAEDDLDLNSDRKVDGDE